MNGMKLAKYTVVAAAVMLAASAARVYAVTVNWNSDDTNEVTLAGGTVGLPDGDLVEIGIFSSVPANGSTAAQVAGALTVFGSGTIGEGTGGGSGDAGTFAITSTAPVAGFAGSHIYVVAFNAATSGAATAVGVFTSTMGTWTFPAADSGSTTIDMDDVAPSGVVDGAGYGVNTFNSAWQGGLVNALELTTVPEPSSIALVVLGLVGGIGMIRRHRS